MKPAKVELVKLPREMTLEQFNQQYPSSIPLEELAIINELESPQTAVPQGGRSKRVVGGRGRGRTAPEDGRGRGRTAQEDGVSVGPLVFFLSALSSRPLRLLLFSVS